MTEFKLKKAKVPFYYVSVDNEVGYFMKCLYYGGEYGLNKLYDKAFQSVIPYKTCK